ncbi:hypothetical protein T484DRAFT_2023712, partial [Baffinella frigidus]
MAGETASAAAERRAALLQDDGLASDNESVENYNSTHEASPQSWTRMVRPVFAWCHRFKVTLLTLVVIEAACLIACLLDAVDGFDWQSWFTLGLLALMLALLFNDSPPEVVFVSATTLLVTVGIITESEALEGFRASGLLAMGVLFIVAKSLEEAGTIEMAVGYFLGRSGSVSVSVLQLCVPVVLVSAFVNDTPVVAMMMPIVLKWSNLNGIAPGKLLIPLSYAAMMGGMCTLIGTSTTLILQQLLLKDLENGLDPGFQLEFFTMTPVTLPVALVGVAYMALTAEYLLPGEAAQASGTAGSLTGQGRRIYLLWFSATAAAHGRTPRDLALHRIPGARLVQVLPGGDEGDEGTGAAAAPGRGLVSPAKTMPSPAQAARRGLASPERAGA